MHVKDILRAKGSTVEVTSLDTCVLSAARHMQERGIGCLVVKSHDGAVLGVVAERNIVAAVVASGAGGLGLSVREVMTRNPPNCSPVDTIESVMTTMTECRCPTYSGLRIWRISRHHKYWRRGQVQAGRAGIRDEHAR